MSTEDSGRFASILRGVAHSPLALVPGREVLAGRFRLQRRLGEGGFGVVYEADDLRDGGRVGLKLLRRTDARWLARFKREFRALSGLVHPNLIQLDELFGDANHWFFTMELIEGTDFLSHVGRVCDRTRRVDSEATMPAKEQNAQGEPVRSAGVLPFDESKLRAGLRQLMDGLAALHAAGRVHRDIKPSNVLVTRLGRVVLIDFGLVTSVEDWTDSAATGTPLYMAPEQAMGRPVGPAADLYAVGVVLYEALTGTVPISGAPLQVLMDKQARLPIEPRMIAPDAPADLSALCMHLLACDPAARPSTSEVCRMLLDSPPSSWRAPTREPETRQRTVFVGRVEELAALRAGFERTRCGAAAALFVCGESGIGKSHLIRHFIRQIASEFPASIVLEGRCHEREAIPYQAIDGVIEGLVRRLTRTPPAEGQALLPARHGLLGVVFPALARIPALARQDTQATKQGTEDELRRQAFVELRELFARLAMHRPTVVFIDDLQWADDDGLQVLTQLLAPPQAPPLLFIAALRVGSSEALPRLPRLVALPVSAPTMLHVGALSGTEARQLAATLLAHPDTRSADPARIAAQAAGNPLFVEELVRHSRSGDTSQSATLDLVIGARVQALEERERRLVELVAVAGAPLPQRVATFAAGLDRVTFLRCAAFLRACNLVRTEGHEWRESIAPYHDRVREAVLVQLSHDQRRLLHGALASAFEASDELDAERLAFHLLEAGERQRAGEYAIAAGEQAARTFAFERAASLFQQALAALAPGDGRILPMRVKLAKALAFAGRGAEAAEQFETAASDAPPREALELHRRTAEQLLQSGHFDRGVAASRAVLRGIGMTLPRTTTATVVTLLFFGTLLRLRGLRFRARAAEELTLSDRTRVDTCFSLAVAIGFVEPLTGFVFQTRALLVALSLGEPDRIARSLAMHAAYSAMAGRRNEGRTQRLLDRAQALAVHTEDVQVQVIVSGMRGIAHFLNGRFQAAAEQLGGTLAALADGSTGLVFERFTARMFMIRSLAFLGRFVEMRVLCDEGMREALAAKNVYGIVNLRVAFAEWTALFNDQPEQARRELCLALAEWSPRGFHLEHRNALHARIAVELYAGEPVRAYELASELLHKSRRSALWSIQTARFFAWHKLGSCALAMLERQRGGRKRLLRQVVRAAHALEREATHWMQPFARVLRAGHALHAGDHVVATAGLELAEREFNGVQLSPDPRF